MSEPESSRAASNRWLTYAAIVAVAGVALYFIDRPVWGGQRRDEATR